MHVRVDTIRAEHQHRTTSLQGIAWWVNNRLVGTPGWFGLDAAGQASSTGGRRWPRASPSRWKPTACRMMSGPTRPGSMTATASSRCAQPFWTTCTTNWPACKPPADGTQARGRATQRSGDPQGCPRCRVGPWAGSQTISLPNAPGYRGLICSEALAVFAHLEEARSGYALLERLAKCSPTDLDRWNALMAEWTATDAQMVLDELGRRLALIEDLQALTDDPNADGAPRVAACLRKGPLGFWPSVRVGQLQLEQNTQQLRCADSSGIEDAPVDRRRPDFVMLPDSLDWRLFIGQRAWGGRRGDRPR